jgi:heme/copper-type cytochrome/quinol oxidase subunit 2
MMPVNKQAVLKLSSNDAILSFWITEFRIEQDALRRLAHHWGNS